MRSRALAGLALVWVLAGGVGAAVLNVPEEYASIQAGIDAAVNGDTVLVAPGLYFEMINFLGKNITVTGTDPNDPGIVGYTIINGQKQGSVVTFKGTETSKAVLAGFTITGGTGTPRQLSTTTKYFYGGGIHCSSAAPTIMHNVIVSNVLPYKQEQVEIDPTTVGLPVGTRVIANAVDYSYGGGIYATGSPTIVYNVICRNTAYRGGGIYCAGGTISNNLIYDNSSYFGGGVYCTSNYCRLTNNTLVSNDVALNTEAGYGGNLYIGLTDDTSWGMVANNIICNADSGGGVYWSGYVRTGAMFRYNDVWGNTPSDYITQDMRTYELITGTDAAWTGYNGNISENPSFLADWSKKYRITDTSPCVSAGDPNFVPLEGEVDIDGDPRVYALRVDIGADEHVGYVRPIAEAGPAQHVLLPQTITLDGSASYFSDPNAGASYRWTQTQGTVVQLEDPNTVRPTFTPPGEGWYVFQLVVRDRQYSSAPDQVLVIVGNERPVADAGPDQLWPCPNFVTLDGSHSRDADPPDQLTYTWTQLDGPPVSLWSEDANPTFLSEQPGVYVFQLVVSDGFASSEPDTVKIEMAQFIQTAQLLPVTTTTSTTSSAARPYGFYPSCVGTVVVYAGATGTTTPSQWSIYRSDPKTGEIVKYDSGTIDTKPKADGDITVWVGGSGSYYNPICTSLCAASVMTGTTVTRLQNATGTTSYGYPAISGRTIVYLRHTNVDTATVEKYVDSAYDVCAMDISDFAHPVSFTIASQAGHGLPYPYNNYSAAYEDYVDVSGNLVVWEKDGDIYGADISDRSHLKIFPICTAPERQYDPAISGHTVVWTDERNDVADVYGADISDPNHIREFEVCVETGWQCQPDIDGSTIVFVDGSQTSGNIQVCCLTRDYGITFITFRDYYWGACPSVHGSMMAWRGGNSSYDISSARMDIAYALARGPIQNVTTGAQYDYIQHALSASAAGDVIVVPPGTHDERIRFGGKNVTVRSTDPNDPNVRSATIFCGDGQLVTFADDETSDCLFTGFTVTGGSYGIYCHRATPTIASCTVTGNRDAGMKMWALAKPLVRRCEVTGNGIGVEMAMETIVRAAGLAAPTLQNCLIVGNRSYGVYGGEPTIANCTIADNGNLGVSGLKPKIDDSIAYFNNSGDVDVKGKTSLTVGYSDIRGGSPGLGNIDADPYFVLRGFWMNSSGVAVPSDQADPNSVWIDGDYHLASQGWRWSAAQQTWVWDDHTSPCIDAGDPTLPIGDEKACGSDELLSERAAPNTRVNMGVYGGTVEASLAPKP